MTHTDYNLLQCIIFEPFYQESEIILYRSILISKTSHTKSCQKTTTLDGRQPSLNTSKEDMVKDFQSSWLVVLRIYVALAVFQPYRDLEAGDNQSLKFKCRGGESNPGPLAPKAKSLTTRPLPLLFQSRSKFKVTRSNILVPCERSCHKEYPCAI